MTFHEALLEHIEHSSQEERDETGHWWSETWQILRCRGSRTVCVQVALLHSEERDEETGESKPQCTTYPPPTYRNRPSWESEIEYLLGCPNHMRSLMKELYICLQNECPAAAVMIVRSILEVMMIQTVGDKGTFAANLTEFHKQEFISGRQRKMIESVLEAGHASMHRGFIPERKDLSTLVDILEGLIQVMFVHFPQAKKLQERIPKRKSKRVYAPRPGS